jgi:hypothetical protein
MSNQSLFTWASSCVFWTLKAPKRWIPSEFMYFVVLTKYYLGFQSHSFHPLPQSLLQAHFHCQMRLGHAMSQAVSCRSLTAKAWFLSCGRQSMWDLLWTEWHWDRFCSNFFGFLLSIPPWLSIFVYQLEDEQYAC